MKTDKHGVYISKSAVRYRFQELVNEHNFPEKVNKYVDIATDIDGPTLLLRTTTFSEFAMIGVELNLRSMAAGATLNVYTSNSGLKSGSPIATIGLSAGNSDNIIEYASFAHRYLVFEFTGLTTGQIHNFTVHGKNH